ncbi:MAG: polysaccharide biosynthesis protein [bacterium]|nr:MAG: polysaccharide biosynthesis protein [bacterium]
MKRDDRKKILIVGAGEAARMVASEIRGDKEFGASVEGYLDDNPELVGTEIDTVRVLGRTDALELIVQERGIDEIIIAIPTAPGRFVRRIVKRCKQADVPFKIVPGVMEIIRGEVKIEQIRDVRVEDLLGRETVEFDIESAKEVLSGKRILITGAGGSIGSELCRQLIRVAPAELVLLGRGENRIFEIEEDLRATHPFFTPRSVICDLRNRRRVTRLFKQFEPQIIFHTAAHKHVHYMERDPEEAVLNNIEGSLNTIAAAESVRAERFIFISTDKAASPGGVMGATKRIIELYLRSLHGKSDVRYITVRFGNVIGSKGSVVPLFLKQIERGGPVTVSSPKATRYFMTVKEASLLVIRAAVIGKGGEVFILDMGEAINILEIAQDIILLTGHESQTEIPIVITGLREGERLHEELIGDDERLIPLDEEKILLAESSLPIPRDLDERMHEMIAAANEGDPSRIIELFAAVVPGFGASHGVSSRGVEDR